MSKSSRSVNVLFLIIKKMKGKGLHMVSFILLVVGGLNWLLVGLFQWEIGSLFGGMASVVSRILYVLVGLAAISIIVSHKNDCKHCEKGMQSPGGGQM